MPSGIGVDIPNEESETTLGEAVEQNVPVAYPACDRSIAVHDGVTHIRHTVTPGRRYRLQSTLTVAGPWSDVPTSDRVADSSGFGDFGLPRQSGIDQQLFRWVEVKTSSGSRRRVLNA